jgi:hypothetical protein
VLFRTIAKEEEETLRARFAGSQADRASAAASTGASTGAPAASSGQNSASSSKANDKGERLPLAAGHVQAEGASRPCSGKRHTPLMMQFSHWK